MKTKPHTRIAAWSGLLLALGCGSESASNSTAAGGAGGALGSAGSAGQAVAGTAPSSSGGTVGGVASTGAAGVSNAGSGGVDVPSGGAAGAGGSSGGGGSGAAGGGAAGIAGTTGAGGSAGGTDAEGWVKIFNGQDLTGWSPLIHKSAYKADPYKTFRADATTHVIKVTYEDYPGGNFDDRCGLLYYDKPLTNYRVRLTYHFLEPQAQNPVRWGKNNSGLMIFGIDPSKVTGDPEFPPLIEIQLLGAGSPGAATTPATTPNVCQPGGMTMTKSTAYCGDNKTGVAAPAPSEWTTVEAEVHVTGDTKVFQYPNKTTPIVTMSGPVYQGKPVTGGYLSIQSESQPIEFKDIELMELP